jgi:hypothetical protein
VKLNNTLIEGLRSELNVLIRDAEEYFDSAGKAVAKAADYQTRARQDWDLLSDTQKQTATALRGRTTDIGARILQAAKLSPLIGDADMSEMRSLFRGMLASLYLRWYRYHGPYPVSEEDRVFGVAPAEQEESPATVSSAAKRFALDSGLMLEKMDLLSPTTEDLPRAIVSLEETVVRRYRPNTAFIMMQIDSAQPRLEDIKNSIKDVFREFGIHAIRSDEIEHQDVITQRILDEIATSEFLIADLTGARPSVYYEVGYAHARGRRPILFRERGTPLHFDLAVHNVPEYENITDLKKKLRNRLITLTNKTPSTKSEP